MHELKVITFQREGGQATHQRDYTVPDSVPDEPFPAPKFDPYQGFADDESTRRTAVAPLKFLQRTSSVAEQGQQQQQQQQQQQHHHQKQQLQQQQQRPQQQQHQLPQQNNVPSSSSSSSSSSSNRQPSGARPGRSLADALSGSSDVPPSFGIPLSGVKAWADYSKAKSDKGMGKGGMASHDGNGGGGGGGAGTRDMPPHNTNLLQQPSASATPTPSIPAPAATKMPSTPKLGADAEVSKSRREVFHRQARLAAQMKRMGMPPLLDKWGSSSLKVGRIVMPGGQAALTTAHDRPHQQQQYHNRPHQQQHYQQQQQGAHNRPHQQQPNQQQQGARVKQSRPLSGKLQEDRVEQQYLQQEHQYQQQREGVRLHSLPVSEALKDSSKEKDQIPAHAWRADWEARKQRAALNGPAAQHARKRKAQMIKDQKGTCKEEAASEMAAEYNTWYQHMNRLTEDEPLTALDGVSHTILQSGQLHTPQLTRHKTTVPNNEVEGGSRAGVRPVGVDLVAWQAAHDRLDAYKREQAQKQKQCASSAQVKKSVRDEHLERLAALMAAVQKEGGLLGVDVVAPAPQPILPPPRQQQHGHRRTSAPVKPLSNQPHTLHHNRHNTSSRSASPDSRVASPPQSLQGDVSQGNADHEHSNRSSTERAVGSQHPIEHGALTTAGRGNGADKRITAGKRGKSQAIEGTDAEGRTQSQSHEQQCSHSERVRSGRPLSALQSSNSAAVPAGRAHQHRPSDKHAGGTSASSICPAAPTEHTHDQSSGKRRSSTSASSSTRPAAPTNQAAHHRPHSTRPAAPQYGPEKVQRSGLSVVYYPTRRRPTKLPDTAAANASVAAVQSQEPQQQQQAPQSLQQPQQPQQQQQQQHESLHPAACFTLRDGSSRLARPEHKALQPRLVNLSEVPAEMLGSHSPSPSHLSSPCTAQLGRFRDASDMSADGSSSDSADAWGISSDDADRSDHSRQQGLQPDHQPNSPICNQAAAKSKLASTSSSHSSSNGSWGIEASDDDHTAPVRAPLPYVGAPVACHNKTDPQPSLQDLLHQRGIIDPTYDPPRDEDFPQIQFAPAPSWLIDEFVDSPARYVIDRKQGSASDDV